MMLDSSLGKLLKNKPVEPSIPANDRLSPSKEIQTAQTSKSEAEVRLVVRFFVEEHIVFNGKIEKVKQLESEELSRIVSRIEWDSSKGDAESPVQMDHLPTDAIEEAPREQRNSSSSCKISDESSASSNPSNQQGKTDAQTNESTSPPAHDDTIIKSSLEYDLPKYNDEMKVAQEEYKYEEPKLENDKVDRPCDMRSTENFTSEHIDNLDYIIESESCTLVTTTMIKDEPSFKVSPKLEQTPGNTRYENRATSSKCTDSSLAAVDRQIIVDTLNDCVSCIEMELHKLDENILTEIETGESVREQAHEEPEKNSPLKEPSISAQNSAGTEQLVSSHNTNLHRNFIKSEKRPLMDAVNVPKDSDFNNHEPNDVKKSNCFTDIKMLSNQLISKEDLSMRMVSSNRPENLGPNRRRSTMDNGPSSKRIRRSSAKDGCKSVTTDRHSEKKTSKRDQKVPVRLKNHPTSAAALAMRSVVTPTTSMSSANHLVRSSRIFAKWTDNHFYPGTILKPSKDRKFTIGFFDGAQRNVAETDLIPLSNILGKQVRVSLAGDYCVNAIVHDRKSSPPDTEPMFDVEYQQDVLIRKCVPLKDIFLTADQGAALINQPIKPEKNPDESMFAGVDLDNIVHVKRSRRLQEMEDSYYLEDSMDNNQPGGRRKRNQYNTRHTNIKSKPSANSSDPSYTNGKAGKKSFSNENPDIPASSCCPDSNSKANLTCLNSNPPSESNSSTSTGSSNATNVLEIGQEFYFDSSSPHRTKTSLLL